MYVCLYGMYTHVDAYTLCVHVVEAFSGFLGGSLGFSFFFQLGCESYPVGSICSSDSTLQKNKAQSLSLSAKGCMINIWLLTIRPSPNEGSLG